MRVLTYHGLDTSRVERSFDKVIAALGRDDFRSADVKKLAGHPYHRAKLDDANRLLLQFVEHRGETSCLVLEVIEQHKRRRREYVSAVLARNEASSSYTPARKLFVREKQGRYRPNEAIAIRVADARGGDTFQPLHEALGIALMAPRVASKPPM